MQRLVGLAYAELLGNYQQQMALNIFCISLGNASLQRHLLAVDTPTLESAIWSGNDFNQTQSQVERTQISVICLEGPAEEEPTVAVIANPEAHSMSTATLQQLMRAMKRMADQMEQLQESHVVQPPTGLR